MNKTQSILCIIAGASLVVGSFCWWGYLNYLQEELPDVDRKTLSKALRRMIRKALTGGYAHLNLDNLDDDAMLTLYKVELFNILAS